MDDPDDRAGAEAGLGRTDAALAQSAALSAADGGPLIGRLEQMGYKVGGGAGDAIIDILTRRPPSLRPDRAGAVPRRRR